MFLRPDRDPNFSTLVPKVETCLADCVNMDCIQKLEETMKCVVDSMKNNWLTILFYNYVYEIFVLKNSFLY